MSHFTVLVVGENPESKLAPYHEYECTGVRDQYVQDIDITDEARQGYEEATEHQVVAPDGTVLSYWDDRCYREMTQEERDIVGPIGGFGSCKIGSYASKDWGDGRGYRAKLHCVPEGYTERTVPMRDVKSFLDWAIYHYGYPTVEDPELNDNHKYGYIRIEGGEVRQVINSTNPNAKWDWYVLGGRWGNYFLLKDGSKSSIARKGDIDLDGMRLARSIAAGERWDEVHKIIAGRTIPNWEEVRSRHEDIEAARKEYQENQVVKDIRAHDVWLDVEDYDCTREEYCRLAAVGAVPTFAVILDGQWYERGEMGWWACVKDEKDADVWAAEFAKMLDTLPDDALLSVYDCHV